MKRVFSLGLAAGLIIFAAACDDSSSGGGGGIDNSLTGPQAVVDLAVSDPVSQQVNIYLDVLNFFNNGGTGQPAPDIVFDNPNSGLGSPQTVYLTADDLVICDGNSGFINGTTHNDDVYIYRGYRSHSSGDVPDITFNSGGSIGANDDPIICLVDEEEDVLIVGTDATNDVKLVYDFSAIADGADPAITLVTLNNANSLINNPMGIDTSGSDLYVANLSNTGVGNPCVTIYRDIATLATNDVPDVELDSDVSFFDAAALSFNCLSVRVGESPLDVTDANALYVTGTGGEVFVFLDADNLSTNDLPDAVLFGATSGLGFIPLQPLIAGDQLYVPSLNSLFGGCVSSDGVTGFSSIGSFVSGQSASFTLSADNAGITSSHHLDLAGNALFVAGTSTCFPVPGNVWIFGNGLSMSNSSQAGLILQGNVATTVDGFVFPVYIDARERAS